MCLHHAEVQTSIHKRQMARTSTNPASSEIYVDATRCTCIHGEHSVGALSFAVVAAVREEGQAHSAALRYPVHTKGLEVSGCVCMSRLATDWAMHEALPRNDMKQSAAQHQYNSNAIHALQQP